MARWSLILSIMISILSCSKKDGNDITNLEVSYLNDFGTCFPTFNTSSSSGYVIRDDKSYMNLRNSIVNTDITCDNANLPSVDFNKYSLIGIFTQGQCSLNNTRTISKDTILKIYTYHIHVISNGTCKMLVTTMNWAKVSKIPDDYSVVFNVIP